MSVQKRFIFVQPALPSYRVPLYERLAAVLGSGFTVYTSDDRNLGVLSDRSTSYSWHRLLGALRWIAPGLYWQRGALSIDIGRGDVLVIAGEPRRLSSMLLLLKARIVGAETIWWGHYWSATSRPWRASLRYVLMYLAGTLLFYTDREVEEYRSREDKRANRKVFALNNGIETSDIIRLRATYDPRRRGSHVLFIGRLTDKTGLPLLIDALARPECAAVSVDVIGTGDCEWEIKRLAEAAGVAGRIRWHGEMVNEARIAEVANQCSLFIYPGSVGLSLIHALAYGIPAIVHSDRFRQMPEFAALQAGVNGLLFESGNAHSLAKSIHTALANPDRLSRMSEAAIQTTTESFNAQDMARRFEAAIVAAVAG